jgi:hypothetical protein
MALLVGVLARNVGSLVLCVCSFAAASTVDLIRVTNSIFHGARDSLKIQ